MKEKERMKGGATGEKSLNFFDSFRKRGTETDAPSDKKKTKGIKRVRPQLKRINKNL